MIDHINSNIEEHKTSDFNEWLQAMKMVAYLPDGTPSGFRRKLWLALSEQYLSMKNIDWETERVKYFSNTTQEDDENLGDQIIKDLHRTGTSLCSGPTGSVNQAKLKRILQGYARWNPEVGYCQGFNMLGALILQVMDMEEMESMKVMLYLIEGIFPSGYFSGSLNGLQVDMAVFRELMLVRLPKLAKHLQRLQGPVEERCCEPPLTNVFTIQWFITMFSTSLPLNSVLRIWDLVLIEGSGVLLRTALAIWSILEEKILCSKTADDFYCKMGKLSADMLNGTIVDSDRLIEKIVEFGPIPQLERLRKKHLNNIKSWKEKSSSSERKIKFPTLDEDDDSDDEAEISSTKTMTMRLVKRRSSRIAINRKTLAENRERIALDIPLLKKQYDRIREHQRQAHTILSAAVARQSATSISPATLTTDMFLVGRNANNVRLNGPSSRAAPTVRRSQYNCDILTSSAKQSENNSISSSKKKTPIFKKKLMCQQNEQLGEQIDTPSKSPSIVNVEAKSLKRNESSSFSDSDNNSSTSTSLCDEDDSDHTINFESIELSPLHQNQNITYPILEYDNFNIYNESVTDENRAGCDDILVKKSLNFDESPKLAIESKFITNYTVKNKVVCSNISTIDTDKAIHTFCNEEVLNRQITNNASDSRPDISNNKTPIDASFLNKYARISNGNSLMDLNHVSESNDLNNLDGEELVPRTNFEFSVNESGVINKYFERVNDIKSSTNINLDLLTFQNRHTVPLSTSTSVTEIGNIMKATEAKQKTNPNMLIRTLSSENLLFVKELEKSETQNSYSMNYPQKSFWFSESDQCQSELANRIIEENSRVLRRILNKDFTTKKNFSFSRDKCVCNVNSLGSPVKILEEKSLKSDVVYKKEMSDINNVEDQKNVVINNIFAANNLLVKLEDNKHISTKIIKNIDKSFETDIENFTLNTETKTLKTPTNGALYLVTPDADINYITDQDNCTINIDNAINSMDPFPMSIKHISQEHNLQGETITLPAYKISSLLNSTSFSNSTISFTEPTSKFISEINGSLPKVSENNNIVRDNHFDQTLSTKDQVSNSNDISLTSCPSGVVGDNIEEVKYFNIEFQEIDATKNENTNSLEGKNVKYYNNLNVVENKNYDVGYNEDSETFSITLNKYPKDHSTINKPESNFEGKYDSVVLSKNCDKEDIKYSFDKRMKAEVSAIQDKDMGSNKNILNTRIECNKILYEENDIKSTKGQFKYLSYSEDYNKPKNKNDLDIHYISNYNVPDSLCLTTNKGIKTSLEKDYIFDRNSSRTDLSEVYNKFSSTSARHSKLELDTDCNTVDTTKQQLVKEIISNIHPETSFKIDSKTATSIANNSITIPILNNENTNNYSEYSKDENINDRLISIKNTIKSIDSLCDDTIYNRFSKRDDEYLYDSKNLLQSVSMKKEFQHLKTYNFEEDNFTKGYTNLKNSITENKIEREKSKYFTSPGNTNPNYSDFINTTTSKLDIRHTTVTSTLYDRILAQSEEKEKNLEKHLYNNASLKDMNLTSLNALIANSQSAENSPLKIKCEKENSKSDSKSCSNILLQLENRT